MARLRVRPATGPDDKPAEGEYVWRLSRIPGSQTDEHTPGAGRPAPSLRLDRATDELTATEPRATDLRLVRHQYALTVTAGDGRELVATFRPGADAPLIPEGSPTDLVRALRHAWRARPGPGAPSKLEGRIAAIEDAAAELGSAASRLRVAQQLGRVDATGSEEQSDYKRDIAAAGGWEAIMQRVRGGGITGGK